MPTASLPTEKSPDAASDANLKAPPRGLAADLDRLIADAAGGPITLGRMIEVLGDRGHAVLIVILTAPFLVLPIPGISTAFGAAIFLLGVCVMLGVRPWLPAFLRRRELSNEKLTRLVGGVDRVLNRVERIVKPRLRVLTSRAWHWSIGLSLCVAAVALALPIPIPFNNVPPAVVLMFLAFGLLERDGVSLLIGHVLNVVLWTLLYFMGDFLITTLQKVWQSLG